MNDKYTLDENWNPVQEPDLMKWATWYETADRKVAMDQIGEAKISTVFIGLDHNFYDGGEPTLWETMVFGGDMDCEHTRCSGLKSDAEAMHAAMLERVKANAP